MIAEHEARGEHFKWSDRKWRKGKVAVSKTDEETGYATEDKVLHSEPDTPVAVGFPPGTAVERTVEGSIPGEEHL